MRSTGYVQDAILALLHQPHTIKDLQKLLVAKNVVASSSTISYLMKCLVKEGQVQIVGAIQRRQLYQLSSEVAAAKATQTAEAVRPFRPLTFFPRPPQRLGGWNAERMPRSFLLEDLKND